MEPPRPPPPPGLPVHLAMVANGHAHVLPAFARLGIADRLADGPKTAAELAAATNTRPEALVRFLAVCKCLELVREEADGTFTLHDLGRVLTTPDFRDEAIERGTAAYLGAWANLDAALAGTAAPVAVDLSKLRQVRSAIGFEAALKGCAAAFSRSDTYVDVGSGEATLLLGILKGGPRSEAFYVGRPAEHAPIKAALAAEGVAHRCGFEAPAPALPAGDVYVVTNLEELGDDQIVALLGRCRAVVKPRGRLLVIGIPAVDPYKRPIQSYATLDLELLLFTAAGKVRTEPELNALCTRSGFTPKRFVALAGAFVLEAAAS